jgi:hypothetical protein
MGLISIERNLEKEVHNSIGQEQVCNTWVMNLT